MIFWWEKRVVKTKLKINNFRYQSFKIISEKRDMMKQECYIASHIFANDSILSNVRQVKNPWIKDTLVQIFENIVCHDRQQYRLSKNDVTPIGEESEG